MVIACQAPANPACTTYKDKTVLHLLLVYTSPNHGSSDRFSVEVPV